MQAPTAQRMFLHLEEAHETKAFKIPYALFDKVYTQLRYFRVTSDSRLYPFTTYAHAQDPYFYADTSQIVNYLIKRPTNGAKGVICLKIVSEQVDL